MEDCFKGRAVPPCLREYMSNVYSLEYTEKPNYVKLKKLFLDELKRNKMRDDKSNIDWISGKVLYI